MGAPFRLQVTAATGEPLPEDAELTVRYHGSDEETFRLASPSSNNDVCCRAGEAVAGELPSVSCKDSSTPDAATFDAILCSLWTDGIAEITVLASGYPDLQETLETKQREDECGLETLDVKIELVMGDAGVE
jgi:hypothetical protein